MKIAYTTEIDIIIQVDNVWSTAKALSWVTKIDGFLCGIHETHNHEDGHNGEKYSVTLLCSGLRIGQGASPASALLDAKDTMKENANIISDKYEYYESLFKPLNIILPLNSNYKPK